MDTPPPPTSTPVGVRTVTHYAICRYCKWQTTNYDDHAQPLGRAQRHNERTRHTVDVHTVTAITIS